MRYKTWKKQQERTSRPESKRFRDRRDPDYARWIRGQPCLLTTGCDGPVQAAHVRSRGAGGDDREGLTPLCLLHHDEQHHGAKSFERKYGLDLAAAAVRLDREYSGGAGGRRT